MKVILILLLLATSVCFAQPTKIKSDQIDESAFRPVDAGEIITPWELTFNVPWKQHTLTVDEDITLTLAGSGHEASSKIDILITGDGTHTLTLPNTWTITGTFDPNTPQQITLYYNGFGIIGDIVSYKLVVDALVTELESAIVTTEVPTQLNLTFNEPVIITDAGWTLEASADIVLIGVASGSGTSSIVFNLSRAILHSETVTVSYSTPANPPATTDLDGFALADITDFPVTVPDPPPAPTQDCDITVIQGGGGDHTTITAGNAAASADDIICIGTGTYRETITPLVNGLTFIALEGTSPIISGFEIVGTSGWSVFSGNIYQKTITLPVNGFNTSTSPITPSNTTLFANQILRNGSMMFEARYPNIDSFDDLMKWESYRQYSYTQGFKASTLTDATIPGSPAAMVGATIVSNGWYDTFASTVTAHDNGGAGGVERLTYSPAIRDDSDPGQYMREAYYLTGDRDLLDAEQEWHYQSGTLYFWQPGGGSPSGTIEYKARNWGFDIRGRSGIKIIGLTFIGVDPVYGDASSTNAVVERTQATFNNHVVRHDYFLWNGVQIGMAKQLGTKLLGSNSVFKDNVWHGAASTMLWMGPNCVVENNKLYDNGYAGNPGGTLIPWAQDGSQRITRNTIYNTGRGALYFGYVQRGSHTNMEVGYNWFYNYGMINSDGGASYAGNQTVTTGLDYHHNWIGHNLSRQTPGKGGLNGGIYFDQASGGGTIHHNVVWDNSTGDIYHQQKYNGWTSALFNIYNNTFASTNTYGGNEHSYKTPDTSPLDVQRNNIYVRRILVNWITGNWGDNANYIIQKSPPHGQGIDPLFVGSGGDGLNYRIQTGSPAKNAGLVIPGITDDAVGVPDIGAYEFDNEWAPPGYVEPADDGTVDDDEWDYSLNWTEDNTALQIMTNQDVHYTLTTGSTATSPSFTNSKVDFYYESCIPHGIARFEVLNNSAVVIATADVDTSSGVACNVGTRETHSFTDLAAGTKTARVTLLSGASIVLDGGRFFD